LEEDVVVGDRAQHLMPGVFSGNVALGAWIDFAEVNLVAADLGSKEFSIRVKLRSAVNDEPQVRPDLSDRGLSGDFFQPIEEYQHPRWDSTDCCDRLVDGTLGQTAKLHFPVGEKTQVERRKRIRPHEVSHFLGRNAAEVAREAAVVLLA